MKTTIPIKTIRLGFTGGTKWTNKNLLWKYLDYIIKNDYTDYLVIFSVGDADGVDRYVREYAEEHNIVCYVFKPAFRLVNIPYNPRLFQARNIQNVDNSDEIYAFFPIGGSRGTQNTVDYANYRGKILYIIKEKWLEKWEILH